MYSFTDRRPSVVQPTLSLSSLACYDGVRVRIVAIGAVVQEIRTDTYSVNLRMSLSDGRHSRVVPLIVVAYALQPTATIDTAAQAPASVYKAGEPFLFTFALPRPLVFPRLSDTSR